MTLGGVGGELRILGKRENWGIFILRIGDRILMKLDIYRKILSLRCSIFDSNWIRGHRGLLEGNINLGKRLEWRDRDET